MKLNTRAFKYLSADDWRVLTAVEVGSKNHEVVPTPLIASLSHLQTGPSGVNKCISTLAKADLIAKVKNTKYDGYRLTYGGLDYLALHSHVKTGAIVHLGSQMGVGKESDIYLITTPTGTTIDGEARAEQAILKLHRLGRTSFRSLKNTRTYHKNRQHCTWQHLSRLSAQKESAAMAALHRAGYPVPKLIGWNRHAVVMTLVPGTPLRAVPLSAFGPADSEETRAKRDQRISTLYAECMELILRFAEVGIIHGDFNEFNILIEGIVVDEDEGDAAGSHPVDGREKPLKAWSIDFPQITSLSHPQAESYFDRDVDCIKRFFEKRYHFMSESEGPHFEEGRQRLRKANPSSRIDVQVEAAGFSKKMARELDGYFGEPDVEAAQIETLGQKDPESDGSVYDEAEVTDEPQGLSEQETNADYDNDDNGAAMWQALMAENGQKATSGVVESTRAANFDASERLTLEALQTLEINSTRSGAGSKTKSKKAAGWAI